MYQKYHSLILEENPIFLVEIASDRSSLTHEESKAFLLVFRDLDVLCGHVAVQSTHTTQDASLHSGNACR